MANDTLPIPSSDADRLLQVFHRFGADGRAISFTGLQAGLGATRPRLVAALKYLLDNDMIQPAGRDPLASERAYRLVASAAARMPEEELAAA